MHSNLNDDGRPGEAAEPAKPASRRRCHEVIDALTLEVTPLREQMALLQERLTLDSRISFKPPSFDGPAEGKRAQRRAGARPTPAPT